ncbi:MAG: malectin domain-containing carbohydrate-binding protein [Planctomycetota bacterium]
MHPHRPRGRFETLERRNLLATLAINAGGPAIGDFLADQFFSGGGTFGPNNGSISPISTAGVTDPAPADVYRTERTGNGGSGGAFNYTIPNLIPGGQYTLRLHFAEVFFEAAGSRVFDLTINDDQPPALDDYDVFVAAGDPGASVEQAVIEEFTVTALAGGTLVLDFAASVNNAKLSALELIGDFPEPVEPTGPRVLFVRGADRSGGFLEAGNDAARTEQLADIFNPSTSGGNHGWNELRLALEAANFQVEQITETAETASGPTDGIHIDFEQIDLSAYSAIVFGSNNAVYDTAAVDAIESYVRGGGSTLFISDANFGGDWADASDSDQQFLDRFGLIAHQDQGTYSLTRGGGDFAVPDHPIFTGVNQFDGEGVTPIRLGTPPPGDTQTLLAGAKGNTRLNEPPFGNNNQGPSRSANPSTDAVLVVATAGAGKVVGHYDRNTFFNQNGAGTNINRFDNKQYALNLFGFLVGAFDPVPGDYDGSGLVDTADYAVWKNAFGATGSQPADGNGDQVVDAADFTIWRDNLGASRPDVELSSPAAAEPQPISNAFTLVSPDSDEVDDPDTDIDERVTVSAAAFDRALLLLALDTTDAEQPPEEATQFTAEPSNREPAVGLPIDWELLNIQL